MQDSVNQTHIALLGDTLILVSRCSHAGRMWNVHFLTVFLHGSTRKEKIYRACHLGVQKLLASSSSFFQIELD